MYCNFSWYPIWLTQYGHHNISTHLGLALTSEPDELETQTLCLCHVFWCRENQWNTYLYYWVCLDPYCALFTRWWLLKIVLYHDLYHLANTNHVNPHWLTSIAQMTIYYWACILSSWLQTWKRKDTLHFLSDPITHGTNHPFLLIGLPVLAITLRLSTINISITKIESQPIWTH